MTDIVGGTSNDNHYIALLSSGIQSNRRGRKRFQNKLAKLIGLAAVLTTLGILLILSYDYYGNENQIIHQIVPSVNKGMLAKYNEAFEQFINRYNKKYTSLPEKMLRFETFVKNIIFIELHNEQNSSYKLALNSFADLTFEEFKKQYVSGYKPKKKHFNTIVNLNNTSDEDSESVKSIDWNEKGCVTPVRNQGRCGSCWSFSTTGAIESGYCAKYGELIELSEQQFVDCSDQDGCNGGDMEDAFRWLATTRGLCTEESYPYVAVEGACKKCKPKVKVSGFQCVQKKNATALANALVKAPVSVAIEADQKAFQFYSHGVYRDACGTDLNHGVLAVGYGVDSDSKRKYWIIKNSWGSEWGLNGFMLLDRSTFSSSGKCGILLDPSYPVIE